MSFELHLQDPTDGSTTLLEHLAASAVGAVTGGAAFAFATVGGVELLLSDPDFSAFLSSAPFDLVVGVDAITTPLTLATISEAQREFPTLTCRALVHDRPNAIFHPKLAWFGGRSKCHVIVGSGNLTRGGLLSNWEAFGHAVLDAPGLKAVRRSWQDWCATNASRLRPLDDEQVLQQAVRNKAAPRKRDEDQVERADDTLGVTPADADVLIAQIPRSSTRWKQANFDLETFQGFFQLRPGAAQRVVLFPVDAYGVVGHPEVRPSVSVQSQNYRIELGLAAGAPYPDTGRPLGVFVRLATRQFRYRLVLPGDPVYSALAAFALSRWQGRVDRMARVTVSFAELQRFVPMLAL